MVFGIALLGVEVSLWASSGVAPALVVVQTVSVAAYLVVGAVAWRHRPHNDTGVLLVLAGFSMWVSGLQEAPLPALAAVGTVVRTLPLATTLHVVLAYPTGRLRGLLARVLVGAAFLASTLLEAPHYLVGTGRLALTAAPGAVALAGEVQVLQTAVGAGGMMGASVLVAVRVLRSGVADRRLEPMVGYRVVAPVVIALAAVLKHAAPQPDVLFWAFVAQAVAIVGLPFAFAAGLLRGSFGRAGEIDELVARVVSHVPTPDDLNKAVADVLGDPRATVVYAREESGVFVDALGRPVPEGPQDTRLLHPVRYGGRIVGGICYRDGLPTEASQLHLVAGILGLAIDQQRLDAQQRALVEDLRRSEDELRQSRRRLVRAEDDQRRRIARDLHDGAQQHLVLLGMNARSLSLAAADPEVRDRAAVLADGLTDVVARFRDFVSGILPAPLQDRGLVPAVHLLAEGIPIPTRVVAAVSTGALADVAQSTLYFVVSEALTNVVKHAEASRVEVRIEDVTGGPARAVRVLVLDDGAGGADAGRGTGLRGLADRVGAVGGTFAVHSPIGGGTTVEAVVPCA